MDTWLTADPHNVVVLHNKVRVGGRVQVHVQIDDHACSYAVCVPAWVYVCVHVYTCVFVCICVHYMCLHTHPSASFEECVWWPYPWIL